MSSCLVTVFALLSVFPVLIVSANLIEGILNQLKRNDLRLLVPIGAITSVILTVIFIKVGTPKLTTVTPCDNTVKVACIK